ncbi:DUF7620 family protein [Streptomyces goshikiensis]|uniref:DUF7620 family protein n=1 Tax=Streptomyces goshikiensis TaxID=1942 RepID=UPI00368BB443
MLAWLNRLIGRGKPSPGQRDADGALARAQRARILAEARRPEVEDAARELRTARDENHFAERFALALRGGT